MEFIVVLLIGVLSSLIIYRGEKSLYNVAGIYVIVWTAALGMATFGLNGLYKPSVIVIVLGCLSMLIMAITSRLKLKVIRFSLDKNVQKGILKNRVTYTPLSRNLVLFLLNIVAYIFSIPYLNNALDIINQQGFSGLRSVAFVSSEYASTAALMFFQIFIGPLFVVTMLLCSVDLGRGFVVKRAILMSVIDVVLYTLLFGGRYMIFQLLIFYVFTMYDGYGKSVIKFILARKKTVIVGVVLLAALVLVSTLRSSRDVRESVYIYFCGSFSYLSYLIKNEIGTGLFLLGRAQFGFIYNFIYLGLSAVTNIEYQGSSHIITQLTQYMVQIGDGVSYNSLGTMLHDFIADYGLYGSMFGVFLFGTACRYVEIAKKTLQRSFYYVLSIYLMYTAVNSVLGYTFRSPAAFMTLVLIYFFCRKK